MKSTIHILYFSHSLHAALTLSLIHSPFEKNPLVETDKKGALSFDEEEGNVSDESSS
jgi:hypothetical protein